MMTRDEILAIYQQGPEAVVALVEALFARLEALEARVQGLEDQLARNSHNSNKPPSSDLVADKPRPKSLRASSGRKPGGQTGHRGTTLRLVDEPERVVMHAPHECTHCGRPLWDVDASEHQRRQVVDLPALRLETTEHRAERKRCPDCGHSTTASFPSGVSASVGYGPRIKAFGVYLNQYQLLPLQRATELIGDVFEASLGEGTLCLAIERCHSALEGTEERIKQGVRVAQVANFDETALDVQGRQQWLHVASTPTLTHYALHPKRGSDAMEEIRILPGFEGKAVHDGLSSYREFGCEHALCNIHHLRELTFIEEQHEQAWAGKLKGLLCEIKGAVEQAVEASQGTLESEVMHGYEARYQQWLEEGIRANPPPQCTGKPGRPKRSKGRNLVDRLDKHRDEVLLFARDFRVPFGNNQAEQDLRMMKVQQKVSGCFRTEAGAHRFCRIRGYISTIRKQGYQVLGALEAVLSGTPLIPNLCVAE
jgi:transposase